MEVRGQYTTRRLYRRGTSRPVPIGQGPTAGLDAVHLVALPTELSRLEKPYKGNKTEARAVAGKIFFV
jgi:hypothetical protein